VSQNASENAYEPIRSTDEPCRSLVAPQLHQYFDKLRRNTTHVFRVAVRLRAAISHLANEHLPLNLNTRTSHFCLRYAFRLMLFSVSFRFLSLHFRLRSAINFLFSLFSFAFRFSTLYFRLRSVFQLLFFCCVPLFNFVFSFTFHENTVFLESNPIGFTLEDVSPR